MLKLYEYDGSNKKGYIEDILLGALAFLIPSAIVFIIYGLKNVGLGGGRIAYGALMILLPLMYIAYMPGVGRLMSGHRKSGYRYLKVKADHSEHEKR